MSDINLKKHKSGGKRGISVLYVIFIASILLAISLGISGILITQIKMLGEIRYSVVAFYAADSGIELALMQRNNPLPLNNYQETLSNGAAYKIFVISGGVGSCDAENYCVESIGSYQKTKRAIKIKY